MIDMNHTLWQSCEWANLRMENDSTITGYKLVKGWGPERHVYFAAVFSRKLTGLRFMQDKKPVIYNTSRFRSDREAWGKNLMACLSFATGEGGGSDRENGHLFRQYLRGEDEYAGTGRTDI